MPFFELHIHVAIGDGTGAVANIIADMLFGPNLHIRNTRRESKRFPGNFHEAEHLDGDTDMVDYISSVLEEEAKRRAIGRADHCISMRPDHGHNILDDLTEESQPGYPAIERMKGLAELRGVIKALEPSFYKGEK